MKWQETVLSEDLLVGVKGDRYYLPLGSLFQALEFPVNVNLSEGLLEGWLARESMPIAGNIGSGRLTVAGNAVPFTPENLVWCQDELYAAWPWLGTWLPIELEIDPLESVVKVIPKEPLPIQLRLERLANRQALSARSSGYRLKAPVEEDPYRLVDWPILDLSVGTSYGENVRPQLQPNAVLAGVGDLGWMTGEFLLSANAAGYRGGQLEAAHLQLSRKDPGGGMLGPLKATEVAIGDVVSPGHSIAGRSSRGLGFSISNAPVHRPFEFDRTELQGPLLPGWEVELYRDRALVDFRTDDGSNTYLFGDVPPTSGKTRSLWCFTAPRARSGRSPKRLMWMGR